MLLIHPSFTSGPCSGWADSKGQMEEVGGEPEDFFFRWPGFVHFLWWWHFLNTNLTPQMYKPDKKPQVLLWKKKKKVCWTEEAMIIPIAKDIKAVSFLIFWVAIIHLVYFSKVRLPGKRWWKNNHWVHLNEIELKIFFFKYMHIIFVFLLFVFNFSFRSCLLMFLVLFCIHQ